MNRTVFSRSIIFGIALALVGPLGSTKAARLDSRNTTRTNVNQNANVNANRNVNANTNANVNRNVNANANVNANRNVNVNTNRNVNVDVDVQDNYHPVARAAAATAAVAVTAAAIGSVTNTLPPSCSSTMVNGITYQNCGGTWYQPQFVGSQVNYVVVNAP